MSGGERRAKEGLYPPFCLDGFFPAFDRALSNTALGIDRFPIRLSAAGTHQTRFCCSVLERASNQL